MSQVLSPWGYLPEGWKLSTIKDEMLEVTDYVANGSFATLKENVTYKETEDFAILIRTADYHNNFNGNFVYIDEHAYNFLSKSRLYGGEIIIANVGSVGEVFKCPKLNKKMSLAPNAIMVKLKGNNDFYYYWFKSRIGKYNILNLVSGSAQPKFNKTHFKGMAIPVPPIREQEKIASILSELDSKIECNRKICANLEAQAQALFKHWFVDFAPFKEGKFVESELGMIPEGWRVEIIDSFCKVFTGRKNSNQAEEDGLYPFFSCSPEPLASNDYLYDGFAVIIAGNGSYTGRTQIYKGRFDLYQRTYACVAKEESFDNNIIFIYYMMKSSFEREKMGGTRGTSIPYIVMKDITHQSFCYNKEWIERFSDIVKPMLEQQFKMQIETSRLSNLRDTLLPKLMSGEIKL